MSGDAYVQPQSHYLVPSAASFALGEADFIRNKATVGVTETLPTTGDNGNTYDSRLTDFPSSKQQ